MANSFEFTREAIASSYGEKAVEFFLDAFEKAVDGADFADNYRAAIAYDHHSLALFASEGMQGCCGSHDSVIMIPVSWGELPVLIGYNYGH